LKKKKNTLASYFKLFLLPTVGYKQDIRQDVNKFPVETGSDFIQIHT